MIKKVKILILFLFAISILKIEFQYEQARYKPVGAEYIQFAANTEFDQQFIEYLEANDISIFRQIENLPYYYGNNLKADLIYPSDEFSIEDKLLSDQNSGVYLIDFSNAHVRYEDFQTYVEKNYNLKTVNLDQQVPDTGYKVFNRYSTPVILISLISVLLCVYIEMFKLSKEILIKTINGYSSKKIITHLVNSDIAIYLAITILSLLGYTMFSGYLSLTEIGYLSTTMLVFLMFSILVRVVMVLIFGARVTQHRKNSKLVSIAISIFYMTLTIAIISLAIVPIYKMTYNGIITINQRAQLVTNKSDYEGYYFVNEALNSDKGSNDTFEQAQENGAFIFNYIPDNNVIMTNQNYLNRFAPEFQTFTLIAPDYLEANITTYCEQEGRVECRNIKYYESVINVLSYDLAYPGKISNPIIVLSDSVQTSFVLPIKNEDILDQIEEDYKSDYTVGRQYYTIDEQIQELNVRIRNTFGQLLLFIAGFIIGLGITTQIYLQYYLEANKSKLLIKTINGEDFMKIYHQPIIIFSLVLIVSLVITDLIVKIQSLPVTPLILILLVDGLISIFTYLYINIYIQNYFEGR